MDLVTWEIICLFYRALVDLIHKTEPSQRIRRLYAVNQHRSSVYFAHFHIAHTILTDSRIVCLHILFCEFFNVFHRTQGWLAKRLVDGLLYRIELVKRWFDLITQSSNIVCIGNQVLDAGLLSILRTKIIPVDFCDVKKSKFLRFLNLWSLLYLFLNLLASKKLPLYLNQSVPLSLCQILLTCGSLESSFYLICFLVSCHNSC